MNFRNDFCAKCGNKTDSVIPEGDHAPRDVCTVCGHIHYVNPKLITGAIPIHEGKVLMCKRDIEPRRGYWTLPAGFMEMNETTAQGAARETFEESEAKLKNMHFYATVDLPHISQVYVFYRAELDGDYFTTTPESSEVKLYDLDQIPWDELAFPVVKWVLEKYIDDSRNNVFLPAHHIIDKPLKPKA